MKTLTTQEAAAALGLSGPQVRRLAGAGRLPGAVHTNPSSPRRGEWLIPATAIGDYQASVERTGRPGRPPKGT
jgi:hypothetical protein